MQTAAFNMDMRYDDTSGKSVILKHVRDAKEWWHGGLLSLLVRFFARWRWINIFLGQ